MDFFMMTISLLSMNILAQVEKLEQLMCTNVLVYNEEGENVDVLIDG